MKKILLVLILLLPQLGFSSGGHSGGHGAHVHVGAYFRSDGTYVQSHYRTAPDGTKLNNWSHIGNVNPYTGKVGTNTDDSPNYIRGSGGYSSGSYSPSYSTGYSSAPQHSYRTFAISERTILFVDNSTIKSYVVTPFIFTAGWVSIGNANELWLVNCTYQEYTIKRTEWTDGTYQEYKGDKSITTYVPKNDTYYPIVEHICQKGNNPTG